MGGPISSSRACQACWARRPGPSLPEQDKARVLGEIGETIADVQRVPPGASLAIEPRWDAFMRGQIEGAGQGMRGSAWRTKFLDGLDDLLRDAAD